jgi:transposase
VAIPHDTRAYRKRNLVERMFCRLKDFRRIATRYDKLARNFLAATMIAAAILRWLN